MIEKNTLSEIIEKLPPFLPQWLEQQYGTLLAAQILQGYAQKRKVTLRVNTLKSAPAQIQEELTQAGITYETVAWSKDALVLTNVREQEVQTLNCYQKGEIYLQSLSSMIPPIVLAPQHGMDILDMAAAPGGKTTQIAAMTENTAHITACEMNAIRAERLRYNLQKQGATGAYVKVTDARRLDDYFSFDQILLDAPCSGSGTISIDDSHLMRTFTKKLVQKSTASQLALLRKALTLMKKGHTMVYSTCSILVQENEEIVKKAMAGTKMELLPITFDGMETLPTLPVTLKETLCIAPTETYEGFFVAKIRKK